MENLELSGILSTFAETKPRLILLKLAMTKIIKHIKIAGVQFAVNPPSAVVAVIVAVPAATAVTRPLALTVATELLVEVQLTFLFDALAGAMVALSCAVAPLRMRKELLSRLTPVTEITAAVS